MDVTAIQSLFKNCYDTDHCQYLAKWDIIKIILDNKMLFRAIIQKLFQYSNQPYIIGFEMTSYPRPSVDAVDRWDMAAVSHNALFYIFRKRRTSELFRAPESIKWLLLSHVILYFSRLFQWAVVLFPLCRSLPLGIRNLYIIKST